MILAMAIPATQCLRQDEVQCEEAVAHMADCCDDFDRTVVDCSYSDYCGVSYPHLSPAESECILDQSCESLRSKNICNDVLERSRGADSTGALDWYDGYLEGEVCP